MVLAQKIYVHQVKFLRFFKFVARSIYHTLNEKVNNTRDKDALYRNANTCYQSSNDIVTYNLQKCVKLQKVLFIIIHRSIIL